jgi:hypothetical protein
MCYYIDVFMRSSTELDVSFLNFLTNYYAFVNFQRKTTKDRHFVIETLNF